MTTSIQKVWESFFLTIFLAAAMILASPLHADVEPDNSGPYKVISASWLGGAGEDALVSTEILPDGTILLAGNSDGMTLPGTKPVKLGAGTAVNEAGASEKRDKGKGEKPDLSTGFLIHLSADGHNVLAAADFPRLKLAKLKLDGRGIPYLLGKSAGEISLAATTGTGAFIARLSGDAARIDAAVFPDKGVNDFGVDSNGDVIVLSPGRVTRYSPDGKTEKWTATFSSHGSNRPGGITVDAKSGAAVLTGYGMTATGHEPYKDPYAYGFDRDGKQLWTIWNPDPKRECGAQFGGNGLMADTTGRAAYAGDDGKAYLVLYADGGNTVCSRDPLDPDKKLDPQVMDGVQQSGPGFGFKGASKTSVIFRVDPSTGKLEKGTWLSAWLTPQRANGLQMNGADADAEGNTFVVGDSAGGCPTKKPWYVAPPGGYPGGGYLAVFDKDFKLTQCGYFPGSSIKSVAQRNGVVVIAGSASKENKAKDPNNPSGPGTTYPVPIYRPIQKDFGGGENDAYFIILKASK